MFIRRKVKFCYHCQKLKNINEFRSAGYSRKGVKLYKAMCRQCEKQERKLKSPKRRIF